MKKLGSGYLIGEVWILVGLLVYYKFNDLENTIFLVFSGKLAMCYAFVGIIFIILLTIFRSQKRIGLGRFYGQVALLVVGILVPFAIFFFWFHNFIDFS